jgi:DNA-directed RNA polymerase specialized sigma24 family protein
MVWETPAVVTADETEQWPAALVDEYTERYWTLVRMATMLLGSRAEAEEVTQDAFLATARAWDRVREVRPYLRRAVVNGATGMRAHRTASPAHSTRPSAAGSRVTAPQAAAAPANSSACAMR